MTKVTSLRPLNFMKIVNKIFSGNIVKEAFDNLPSGICFFDRDHFLILCNKKMYDIFYMLSGRELQMENDIQEVIQQLDNNTCVLSDGSVWYFEKRKVATKTNVEYIQYTAAEVTEMNQIIAELDAKKRELSEVVKHMEEINKNILSIAKEEEVRSIKAKIHSDLGSNILNTRNYYKNHQIKQKKLLVATWKRTLAYLTGELEAKEEDDMFSEIQRIAKNLGVKIHLNGILPENEKTAYLILCCVRECLTNIINHASGKTLFVQITEEEDYVRAILTNDGNPPKQEVIEGSGLGTLRENIEKNGGSMSIQSFPRYQLTVNIPKC